MSVESTAAEATDRTEDLCAWRRKQRTDNEVEFAPDTLTHSDI